MCGGEVLKEKGDEQMPLITFCVRALKKKWLSSFRLSKAFDAQYGTAEEWTVGPYSDDLMCLVTRFSHAHGDNIDYGVLWKSLMCDGYVDIN